VIVSNDAGNKHGPTVVVAPITGQLKKKPLPTHVAIPKLIGLDADSVALTEQVRTLDRTRLGAYVGRINSKVQMDIDDALAVCVGIDDNRYKKAEILTLCLCHRCESNSKDSGYVLIKKGWQAVKDDCDFCELRRGIVFGIFSADGLVTGNLDKTTVI
jgi:mRNA interferase MazF